MCESALKLTISIEFWCLEGVALCSHATLRNIAISVLIFKHRTLYIITVKQ